MHIESSINTGNMTMGLEAVVVVTLVEGWMTERKYIKGLLNVDNFFL